MTGLPKFLKEAEDRGDRYALTSMRTRLSPLVRLANDEPEKAREELDEAIALWPADGFLLQHWYRMTGEAECLLYAGAGSAALRLTLERWPSLRRSFMLRVQSVLIHSLFLRARAVIAARSEGSAAADLASAESDARRIERERTPWGDALARLLRAGIASVAGDRAAALAHTSSAERYLAAADMALHAAVAGRGAAASCSEAPKERPPSSPPTGGWPARASGTRRGSRACSRRARGREDRSRGQRRPSTAYSSDSPR